MCVSRSARASRAWEKSLARPCELRVVLEAAHDALATSNAPELKE
jgi:hypothetical protein